MRIKSLLPVMLLLAALATEGTGGRGHPLGVAFGKGSGASYKAFISQDADAWITWPNWPATKPDLDEVALAPERVIWRDVNVALSPDADPAAQAFLDYLVTEEAQEIMATEGWVR